MTPEQFCYWLQGYFEISGGGNITAKRRAVIEEHLQLVLNKQTSKPDIKGKTYVRETFVIDTDDLIC